MKENCWEIKNCGREEGGKNAAAMGVCPAYTAATTDGKNGGKNAGRYCWKVAGTFCGGKVQGSWATKITSCSQCDFFQSVRQQEGQAMLY